MIDARSAQTTEQPVEETLQRELALGDAVLGTVGPVLGYLLINDDHSLFSDEIVARIRGMIASCARQLVTAHAKIDESEEADDGSIFGTTMMAELAESLTADPAFLTHCHALAVEWHLAERLQARNSIDPVLSPLVQALICSPDAATATNAMSYLAAQARFMQQQRRMELPLTELPGDLFHTAVLTLAAHANTSQAGGNVKDTMKIAEARLRKDFDEGKSRLGLLSRLIMTMGSDAKAALSISYAGPSAFLTALAAASNQQRELTVISTNDRQLARLALSMCAAGLTPQIVDEQFALIHPEIVLPEGFAALRSDRAAVILASSNPGPSN